MIKNILRIAMNILIFLLAMAAIFCIVFLLGGTHATGQSPGRMNLVPMVVLSGSMQPQINAGDVVISKSVKPKNIKVGEIITYKDRHNSLITHRVVAIIEKKEAPVFITKGDANNVVDQSPVYPAQIVGVKTLRIPYGGYIANFIKSKTGFSLIIILPTIFLLCGELKNILLKIRTS